MKALENLMGAFSVVLVLLNALGGVVAGIWLAILGEWGSIGYGLMFGIGGAMLISFAMLPGMLLAGPAVMMDKKGIKSGFYLFGFLSAVYTFGVLTAWCRSEEHTSELQSLMRISYAVFCLKKKKMNK